MGRKHEKIVCNQRLHKGLKIIHIGDDVYRYGKQTYVTNPDKEKYGSFDKILHMVIYAPQRKEYHLWGADVMNFTDGTNRHGNKVMESEAKIYILTSILDNKENWCFDLTKIPEKGYLKVIYDNGTVKNIDFDGNFTPVQQQKYVNSGSLVLDKQGFIKYDESAPNTSPYTYMNPIAYRKK